MIQSAIPEELRIAVTNKCNLNCKHCYVHNKFDKAEVIDVGRYLSLLDDMSGYLKLVSITGGEPLVAAEDVFSICKKCKELGIKVRLVSNGTLLSDLVIKRLKDLKVDLIQMGVDSIEGEFHDFIREKGSREKTIESIKKCVKAGINISVRYTLAKSNLGELVNSYKYFSKLGVYKFKLRMLFPAGQAKKYLKNQFISGKEWAQAQFQIIEESLNGVMVEITQPCLFEIPVEYNVYKEMCPCGLKAAYINWNGDVKYCLYDEYIIGNIKDRSFLDIWGSPLIQKERKKRYKAQLEYECSSFAILKDQYDNYNKFIKEYITTYRILGESL